MFRERRGLGPAQVVYARRGSAGSRIAVADVDRAADAGVFDDARWLHVTGITPGPLGRSAGRDRAGRRAGAGRRPDDQPRPQPAPPALVGRGGGTGPSGARRAGRRPPRQPRRAGRRHRQRPMTDPPAELARAALALGPATAIVKLGCRRGPRGRARRPRRGRSVRPAVPLPVVVDPVGAGDAFCAGFIAARLEGATLADALDVGNACGAAAAAALGDQTGLPDRDRAGRPSSARGRPSGAPTRSDDRRRSSPRRCVDALIDADPAAAGRRDRHPRRPGARDGST